MKTTTYKWMATKGPQHGATVGCGFFTRKDAVAFALRENRRFNSGYYVVRVAGLLNPKFNN